MHQDPNLTGPRHNPRAGRLRRTNPREAKKKKSIGRGGGETPGGGLFQRGRGGETPKKWLVGGVPPQPYRTDSKSLPEHYSAGAVRRPLAVRTSKRRPKGHTGP